MDSKRMIHTKTRMQQNATDSGADMAIMDAKKLTQIYDLMEGKSVGTLFLAHENDDFDTVDFIVHKGYQK